MNNLTWQETDVLKILKKLDARPGHLPQVRTICHNWGTKDSNQEFGNALLSLVAKGLLQTNPDQSSFALTDAGYAQIAN